MVITTCDRYFLWNLHHWIQQTELSIHTKNMKILKMVYFLIAGHIYSYTKLPQVDKIAVFFEKPSDRERGGEWLKTKAHRTITTSATFYTCGLIWKVSMYSSGKLIEITYNYVPSDESFRICHVFTCYRYILKLALWDMFNLDIAVVEYKGT